jgi:two-component system response regulator RegA
MRTAGSLEHAHNSHEVRQLHPATPPCRQVVLVGGGDDLKKLLLTAGSIRRWEVQMFDDHRVMSSLHDAEATVIVDICPDGKPCLERVPLLRCARAWVIAVTAYPSLSLAVAATKAGADDCIALPLSAEELIATLEMGARSASETSGPMSLPSLAKMEWDYIARVLDRSGGNISRASRTLGIRRSTLQRKLKKYPPPW